MHKYLVTLPLWATMASAQTVSTLPTIVAQSDESVGFSVTVEQAKQAVQKTAGGINVIEPAKINGNLHTLRDALQGQPGITTTEFFGGNDNPVITIRGSGLNSAPPDRGILYLENGLPMNEADGTYYPGALDARNASAIIVRRGANALNPGLDAFGGEIDFYNANGRTETGALSLSGGSYGTASARFAVGGVSGNWDYHVSANTSRSDGFRYHNQQYRHAAKVNIGYQNGNFENRTVLSYANQHFEIPGPQSLDDLYADPRSVANKMPLTKQIIYATDPSRNNKTWRAANLSSWKLGNTSHSLGFYYQHTKDYFKAPPRMLETDSDTYGIQYKVEAVLDNVTVGGAISYAETDTDKLAYIRKEFVNTHLSNARLPGPVKLTMNRMSNIPQTSMSGGASNFSAQFFTRWAINDQWSLDGQLRYTRATRDFTTFNDRLNRQMDSMKRSYSWLSPRLGISFQPSEDHRIFANISAHREVPTMGSYLASYTPMTLSKELDVQKAISFEVGARGVFNQQYSYDVAIYRTNLKNEFLSIPDPMDPTSEISSNYRGNTYHQGIELGLGADWDLGTGNGHLKANVAYTLNDFRFSSGHLKGNKMSGVPRHVLMLGLTYEKGPWSFGVNSRSALGKMPAGNDNALYVGGYTVYGAKVTYEANKNLNFYVQGDNLTNKRYVAWTFSGGNVSRDALYFLAGYGRSISAGVNFRF